MQIRKISFKNFIIYFYLVFPLFFSVNPLSLIYKVPGEVIPWAVLLLPLLFLISKKNQEYIFFVFEKPIFRFYITYILFITLGFLLIENNLTFITKSISLLNPFTYAISLLWLIKNRFIQIQNFLKIIFWVNNFIILTCLFTYISPGLIDFLRSLFVNDLIGRKSIDLIGYSGPAGFYSEPSYQGLFVVSILITFISTNLTKEKILIIIQCLFILFIVRSITALAICFLALFLFFSYLIIKYIFDNLFIHKKIPFNKKNLFILIIVLPVIYFLVFQSGYLEYARFQRLFEIAQEFNLISIEGLIKVENLFGSTRFTPMIVGFMDNKSIPELLINNFCLINCDNFYSNKYFPSSFSVYFSFIAMYGFILGNLLISWTIYILYKYDLNLKNNFLIFENSKKMNIRSLIFGLFSIIFLGPIGSPLLFLPFISII